MKDSIDKEIVILNKFKTVMAYMERLDRKLDKMVEEIELLQVKP